MLETIEDCLVETACEIIPQRKMSPKSKLNIWWNEQTQKAKKERRRASRNKENTRATTDNIE